MAVIEDAYQTEFARRLRNHERLVTFRKRVETAGSVSIILRADHTIAYFSPFAEDLTGHEIDDASGENFLALFLPEAERVDMAEEFGRVISGGEPSHGYLTTTLCKDGDPLLGVERPLIGRLAAIGQMVTVWLTKVATLFNEVKPPLKRWQWNWRTMLIPCNWSNVLRGHSIICITYTKRFAITLLQSTSTGECAIWRAWRDTWAHLEIARRDKRVELREEINGLDLNCQADPHALEQLFRNKHPCTNFLVLFFRGQ